MRPARQWYKLVRSNEDVGGESRMATLDVVLNFSEDLILAKNRAYIDDVTCYMCDE